VRSIRERIVGGMLAALVSAVSAPLPCLAADGDRYIVRFKTERTSPMSPKALLVSESVRAERVLSLDNSVVVTLSAEQRIAMAARDDVESIEVDQRIRAYFEPNDTSFSQQEGLNGAFGISAPAAWDITAGSASKLVAVVDSGADFSHEDLQGSFWSNPGEIASNGIDDDGNGYIDDIRGYDFGSDIGDSDPTDENGHGTHVSGIIAATGNNAVGVIGVAWQTKVIPVKCLDDTGNGYLSYLVNALDYVARLKDQGYPISIVNMSLGTDERSEALNRAVERVSSRGILLVAAAGNNYGRNNDEIPSFPANTENPNVIAVAASNSSGSLASFSNYGPTTVDVAAPGDRILSTVPVALKGELYEYIDGTSMAAPHVSGIAALVAAANPSAKAELIKGIILATVTPRRSLSKKTVSGGIVNAHAAAAVGVASQSLYKITGSVKRHKRGVGKVAIVLKLSSGVLYRRTTTTTSTGRFSFSDVPGGTYTVTPSRAGLKFSVKSRRIALTSNKQVSFTAR
jgi:subtilisin family serine protease